MQLNPNDTKDRSITHEFELNGKRAIISCAGDDDEFVATVVTVGDLEPIAVGGFHIVDAEYAALFTERNREWLQADGTLRPSVQAGDIMDIGPGHNTGAVQELLTELNMNPEDITDFDYVDLSVRAAAMALARKLALAPRRTETRGKGRVKSKQKKSGFVRYI